MTVCTCGQQGICLTCQLTELELVDAADLLLLDPFVVASCPRGCVDTDGCGCEWNQAVDLLADPFVVAAADMHDRLDGALQEASAAPPRGEL